MAVGGISIWTIVVLFLFAALPLTCISSAQQMPPSQGGVAGWLRWYAVCYAFYTLFFLSPALSGDLSAVFCLLITLPFATAVWIRSPLARGINLYGNYFLALICLPLAFSGAAELWALIGSGFLWGTYFLRSQRVRATYRLAS